MESVVMDKTLKISLNLAFPREAATWVISYLAKRGAGKTYCAAVQAEEMLKAGIPIVIIDGMGIFWGLRVSSDGIHSGLPVVVFGGEHADLPLSQETAPELAKAIVESNISCVLDLSPFSKYIGRKIVSAFLNELYRLNRVERHVFIEESDLWAPQRPIGQDEALCLSAVDNFVRRGGNHNLGCTLITQRSAVLNKDILTQSDCLVVLRTLAPQDKKAIQSWVEEQTDEDKKELNQWYDGLKSLENGEAWVWHPEKPAIFMKVKFRQRETFHATREFIRSPRANKIVLMSVDEFVARFKKVFESTASHSTASHSTVQQGTLQHNVVQEGILKELEEFRSGRKLAESVQQQLKLLGEKLDKMTEAEATRCDQLEKAHQALEKYEKFAKGLVEILPSGTFSQGSQPLGNGSQTVKLDEKEVVFNVSHSEKTVELSTEKQLGRIMFVAVNDLPKEGFTESELSRALQEHGWNISHSTLAPTLSSTQTNMGLLMRVPDSKPAKYRVPGKVKVNVKKED